MDQNHNKDLLHYWHLENNTHGTKGKMILANQIVIKREISEQLYRQNRENTKDF